MDLHSEIARTNEKIKSLYSLTDTRLTSHDTIENLPKYSNDGVSLSFECDAASHVSGNFGLERSFEVRSLGEWNGALYSFERSFSSQASEKFQYPQSNRSASLGELCSLEHMSSDYYVASQISNQLSENQSLVSIGLVTLEERSRQSSFDNMSQASQTSGHMLGNINSTSQGHYSPQSTIESIHDVKNKKPNFLRRKLEKWNLINVNKVGPPPEYVMDNPVIEVIDGETLIKVGNSKDVTYYFDQSGLLGKGGFGLVYAGYGIKGNEKIPVAVKFVRFDNVSQYRQDKELGRVPSEVYFLKQMKYHRNVIEFLHYEQVSAEHFVIICERPVNCKDLYDARSDRGGIFMEHEAKRYAKMLVDVTLAMEKKGIVHRDYKLENIIYDPAEDTIKVIDFGMATEHKPGKLHQNFCGTETNRPPEMIKNGWYDPSKEAVRNIGLIIYEMFYGQFPYTDYINYKTFADVTAGLPNLDDLPDEVRDLVTQLLAMDPDERPSIKRVAKHSWFRTKRSFTSRLSSFVRHIFRKRRGSYTIRASASKQSAVHSASASPPPLRSQTGSQQASQASQVQSGIQLSSYSPRESYSQLDSNGEQSYQEQAIDVGDLVDSYDGYQSVTSNNFEEQ